MTLYVTPRGYMNRRNMLERMMQDFDEDVQYEVRFPMDVRADDEAYEIKASLPGVKPEDINIQIVNETVTISGEIKNDRDEKASYLLAERPAGRFNRTLTLPVTLDANKAEAAFEYGVLTLRVPKAEAARPKTIKINAK
ncbi:MAG: Hsp20/alpha crystallin family protein [Anaerolineaceae bacterium]